MRVAKTQSDDEDSLGFDEPENFERASGIAIGNGGDEQRHAKSAGKNESETPAAGARKG